MRCPKCQSEAVTTHSRKPLRLRCQDCRATWRPDPVLVRKTPATEAAEAAGLTVDGNSATLISRPSHTIPTIESVLEEFGVDTDIWTHDTAVVNRWEMGYTDQDKKPGSYPLYQVKIPLFRKIPIGVDWPVFKGAVVKKLPVKKFTITRGLKRAIIMPDLQVGFRRDLDTGEMTPFHDPVACSLFATVVKAQQPDILVSVGDNLDCTEATSKFLIEPEFYFTTQASLDWLASYLWMLRPWVQGDFIYLEGNHEKRLPNFIAQNSLFACRLRRADRERLRNRNLRATGGRPVLSVPGLLGLDEMGITWVEGYPSNRYWINDNLRATHGEKLANKSGMSAGRSLDGARCSMLFGHSHRLESAHVTVHARDKARVYGAYNVGTLARVDGVVPSNAAEENWQQGFAVVDYTDKLHQVQLVNIYRDRCIFEGNLYAPEFNLDAEVDHD